MKKKLLLQSCCGPCSTTGIKRLEEEFDITLFFWGSNIHPKEEYLKRLEALNMVNAAFLQGKESIVVPYNAIEYFEAIKGMENEIEGGKRCDLCFELRLEACAKTAKEKGFDTFASTLTVSPHKNAKKIDEIGFALEEKYGVPYFSTNLKKQNGFLLSTQLSKQLNLYRQNYCGCIFSKQRGYQGAEEDESE